MNVLGADPFVLFDPKSQSYYCYCTGPISGGKAFLVYRSADLVAWEFVSNALDLTAKNWGKDWFWAPECFFNAKTGLYFLFYSARVREDWLPAYFCDPHYVEGCKIGVAVASSPEGPFVNIASRPLDYRPFDPTYRDINVLLSDEDDPKISFEEGLKAPQGVFLSSIDVDLLFFEKHIYLYYSRCCYRNYVYDEKLGRYIEESNILGVELDPKWWDDPSGKTMPSVLPRYLNANGSSKDPLRKDGFVRLVSYGSDPQEWENAHVNDHALSGGMKKNRRWAEGPTVVALPLQGKTVFAMTYSCNNYENARYGVGIAFAPTPLGPFAKAPFNPILHQDPAVPIYSTGHGSWIAKEGQTYYFFHGREDPSSDRILYFGPLRIVSETQVSFGPITQCRLLH
jgi:hypothetical protein